MIKVFHCHFILIIQNLVNSLHTVGNYVFLFMYPIVFVLLRDLASFFAYFLSPLVPNSSQRSSKCLHYLSTLTSPFSVMASTCICLLSILSTSGVLRILKQLDKYYFWIAWYPSTTYFTWPGVSTDLSRTIWYGFDRKDIRY